MADEQDDNQVVAAVLRGEASAFEHLVRRYHGPLRRLALQRTSRPDIADDIVQETFMAAYRSLHTYNAAYNFRTWLWTIHINQCRRHGSRAAKLPTPISVGGGDALIRPDDQRMGTAMVSESPSPTERMEAQERARHLQDLLELLPECRADAVRLRFYGELKYREIAETLGCSLSAAKKWVREGLLAMSDAMQKSNSPYRMQNETES